jgi:hypothetical protein
LDVVSSSSLFFCLMCLTPGFIQVSKTNVPGEFEFLYVALIHPPHPSPPTIIIRVADTICDSPRSYSPYSVMKVESVTLPPGGAQPTAANPIRIVIVAALDNKGHPPDLPLAPWA